MLFTVCGACGKAMDINASVKHIRTGIACHATCAEQPIPIRIHHSLELYAAVERILEKLGIHD